MAKKTRNRMYEPYGYRESDGYLSLRNHIDNEIIYNRRTDQEQDNDIDTLSGDIATIKETLGTITDGSQDYASLDERITTNADNIDDIFETGFFGASYNPDSSIEAIQFFNKNGDVVISVPLKDIIGSNLIQEAYYDKEAKQIVIRFDNGDIVRVDCKDLIDITEYGIGLELVESGDPESDGKILAVKKDETSERVIVGADGEEADVLTISDDGVKVANIQKAIDVETERAKAAEAQEKAERTATDETLLGLINAEKAERVNEVARLDARIDAEREDRETQAADLNTRMGALENNLQGEVLARQAKDNEITTLIMSTKSELTNSITNSVQVETNRATAAENLLRSELLSEKERAIAAENTLTNAVRDERDRALAAERALSDRIDDITGEGDESLEARVRALEDKMEMILNAIHIDGNDVKLFVEGEWTSVNDELRQITNEVYDPFEGN